MQSPPPLPPSESDPASPRPLRGLARWLMMALAVVALVLAVAGVILPGLPTTPFVLLAAWAAARSSPRLAGWLEAHRLFGPLIRNWRSGGRVSRRAKRSAAAAMAVCAVLLLWLSPSRWGAAAGIVAMACVLVWLWRRPEP
ncbi:membrane protein [Pseudacidovorax intermedius]|uniref:Membrane protein n=1 Tax=Pseudacidovorax intermedius TaxID=433924 RepID=A0A147GZJ5_9BURK|nr:membrane protein [Pseudacidovorax intermedius]